MGAIDFQVRGIGPDMRTAYKALVADALEEYGSDAYNGTISTTHGFEDKTAAFKASGKKLQDYINDETENTEKWGNCFGICVKEPKGNENQIKTQVQHHVHKGRREWKLLYVVYEYNKELGVKELKEDAVTMARQHTEKTQNKTQVILERRLVGSNPLVATITYKKSSKESDGEYIFFGMAAT